MNNSNLKKLLAVSIASIAMLSLFASCNKKEEDVPNADTTVTEDEAMTDTDMDAPASTEKDATDADTEENAEESETSDSSESSSTDDTTK